jgi:hypothetical protein
MRKYLTPKQRRTMHAEQDGLCAGCLTPITVSGCIAEHWFPVALGNASKPDCLLCRPCAALKTNGSPATSYGSDAHAIAKDKRLRGITKTGPKKRIPSRPLTDPHFRKRMNGRVEVRE